MTPTDPRPTQEILDELHTALTQEADLDTLITLATDGGKQMGIRCATITFSTVVFLGTPQLTLSDSYLFEHLFRCRNKIPKPLAPDFRAAFVRHYWNTMRVLTEEAVMQKMHPSFLV